MDWMSKTTKYFSKDIWYWTVFNTIPPQCSIISVHHMSHEYSSALKALHFVPHIANYEIPAYRSNSGTFALLLALYFRLVNADFCDLW